MKEKLKEFLKRILPSSIIYIIRKIKLLKTSSQRVFFKKKIVATNKYKKYKEYLKFQKEKTLDPKRIKKWLNEEWEIKYSGFKEIFERNNQFLFDKSNAICLGARTGQEVKALIDLGINAIGIDLVPFPPYTIEGDIHNLKLPQSSFDFVFTNIFDHSLYPDKFCSEMERVCQSEGVIILHLQLGIDGDKYSENIVHEPSLIYKYFKNSKIVESRGIRNTFDGMNWELIFKKN